MSNQADRDMVRLQAAGEQLGEHFDTVQIVATRHEQGLEGGTISVTWGCGNGYARCGSVRSWLKKEEQVIETEDDE